MAATADVLGVAAVDSATLVPVPVVSGASDGAEDGSGVSVAVAVAVGDWLA
ncbi:hypothetical protein [Glutamicibacter nicotianae]|uniref:hypothetical protein n=1 Tax=Glutamicibacter nicotianae TaxID=37929 RepID=UPI0013CE636B|nr:hypothetical protein [Glutamicibacter nicotianae]